MELDPFMLARMQFAANISFHILFPTITITIGLCWILLYFRVRFALSGDKAWEYAYSFWVKIFALSFALGVVSGITMSFQFGTNWPVLRKGPGMQKTTQGCQRTEAGGSPDLSGKLCAGCAWSSHRCHHQCRRGRHQPAAQLQL